MIHAQQGAGLQDQAQFLAQLPLQPGTRRFIGIHHAARYQPALSVTWLDQQYVSLVILDQGTNGYALAGKVHHASMKKQPVAPWG
ncbi:hypothetical protein D9M68_827700 [compost metagenome]